METCHHEGRALRGGDLACHLAFYGDRWHVSILLFERILEFTGRRCKGDGCILGFDRLDIAALLLADLSRCKHGVIFEG